MIFEKLLLAEDEGTETIDQMDGLAIVDQIVESCPGALLGNGQFGLEQLPVEEGQRRRETRRQWLSANVVGK